MGQALHGSAKITHAVRAEIQRSKASVSELNQRYGINPKTVRKALKNFARTDPIRIGLYNLD
jgi:transposase-like protein